MTLFCSWKEKIERLILGKAYRVRTRLTFFLLDLYNFSKPYHKKVKDFNTISFRRKAKVFFLWSPGVKILFLKKIFYQKDASRIKEEGKRKG
jgi:hypothetical protein